jgi:hypothetical protein
MQPVPHGALRRPRVIIDLQNICRGYGSAHGLDYDDQGKARDPFSLGGMEAALAYFADLNIEAIGILPRFYLQSRHDKEKLNQMCLPGHTDPIPGMKRVAGLCREMCLVDGVSTQNSRVKLSPPQVHDDNAIIQFLFESFKEQGVEPFIVTDDLYRKEQEVFVAEGLSDKATKIKQRCIPFMFLSGRLVLLTDKCPLWRETLHLSRLN